MPKILTRIFTLVVIPSLLANPSFALALNRGPSQGSLPPALFTQQVLIGRIVAAIFPGKSTQTAHWDVHRLFKSFWKEALAEGDVFDNPYQFDVVPPDRSMRMDNNNTKDAGRIEVLTDLSEVDPAHRNLSKPKQPHAWTVTKTLIAINIGIYVTTMILGWLYHDSLQLSISSFVLELSGGNFRRAILEGEIWRLVMPGFLHVGLWHIVGNMLFLATLGRLLEPVLGRHRTWLVYFVSVVGGNIVQALWNPGLSVGASTAVYGFVGAYVGLPEGVTKELLDKARLPTVLTVIYLLITLWIPSPGVGTAGHIGGFIFGCLFICFFELPGKISDRDERFLHLLSWTAVAVTGFSFFAAVYHQLGWLKLYLHPKLRCMGLGMLILRPIPSRRNTRPAAEHSIYFAA